MLECAAQQDVFILLCSFGQSAIFLIGGKSKQIKPTPILLRSGDVVIMSSEARLSYHGVPRILAPPEGEKVPLSLSPDTIIHEMAVDDQLEIAEEGYGDLEEDPQTNFTHCQALLSDWSNFESYLALSRININVRQVVTEMHKF